MLLDLSRKEAAHNLQQILQLLTITSWYGLGIARKASGVALQIYNLHLVFNPTPCPDNIQMVSLQYIQLRRAPPELDAKYFNSGVLQSCWESGCGAQREADDPAKRCQTTCIPHVESNYTRTQFVPTQVWTNAFVENSKNHPLTFMFCIWQNQVFFCHWTDLVTSVLSLAITLRGRTIQDF